MSSTSSDDGHKEKKTPLDRFMKTLLRRFNSVPVELVTDEAKLHSKAGGDRNVVIKNISDEIRGGQSPALDDRWSNSASPSSKIDFDLPFRSRRPLEKQSLEQDTDTSAMASLLGELPLEELQPPVYCESSKCHHAANFSRINEKTSLEDSSTTIASEFSYEDPDSYNKIDSDSAARMAILLPLQKHKSKGLIAEPKLRVGKDKP